MSNIISILNIPRLQIFIQGPPDTPFYGEDIPHFINPEDVIAGFANRCLYEEKVQPYFSGNIKKFYKCFRGLIKDNPGALAELEMKPDETDFEYFYTKVRPCLYPPISQKIDIPGVTHYQANIKLIERLNILPVIMQASARSIGSEFYDKMICDRLGRDGRTSRLRNGDLGGLF